MSVDIVVNNYNYARFLPDAIDSALAQTYPDVNVIVVDDGSTDESRDILNAYAGKAEIVLKENGGQASAVNAGFQRSTSDVVIFLDADDVLSPSAAAIAAAAFAANDRLVKVQYRMEVIDKSGRRTGTIKPPAHMPLFNGDVRRAELTFPFDLPWLGMSANAFRSSAVRRISPLPEQSDCPGADWYLVHLTALLGEVASLDEVGGCYRVHGGNMYEPQNPVLDLAHIRNTISCAAATREAIERLATDMSLDRARGPILSVSDLANRLISAKLDPDCHPIAADHPRGLLVEGTRAAMRRFDVSLPMKLLYAGWFIAMAITPPRLGRHVAEPFLFPERRRRFNRILRRLYA